MNAQISRNNHYVPQWYQRGFLPHGQAKLHVLDMSPVTQTLPNGKILQTPPFAFESPKRIFCRQDMYTTKFGEFLNDDIEKYLFGSIDKRGAEAIQALIENDLTRIHKYFHALFDYLDTQKLRTPKGLDWIFGRYRGMNQTDLMIEMQSLRDMHCTMWTECVREIVSAKNSAVKFLVSDHPVTTYHRDLLPNALECRYPMDPGIDLIGSQTVFALDADHCLILTNLEYAKSPSSPDLLTRRTHARFRATSMTRTDALLESGSSPQMKLPRSIT